ncbi:AAA family ATPase [Paenibacillus fonticola]|uniref:AAA family ATPase n=1 Tax=Paenibacillus fonticola TaxID=379896 RepID=UPI000366B6CE|nr:AAA family ATPase [Paenibacillus fonticola]
MRLDKLLVNGFGHLSGLELQLGGAVTVLYGPNEAGKSTLLGFVRAMLFGIPSRAYGPLRYEPSRGGAHGGMLTLQSGDGERWIVERYAASSEGRTAGTARGEKLRITRSDSAGRLYEVSQDVMQRELLGGMSSDMFKQLFAVSLTELQEVSALQSEELSRYLFHAGIGGGAAVLRGEKKIVQELDRLYRPRGRNQEIPQLLRGYERLEQEAEAAKMLLPRYNEVLEELEQVRGELLQGEGERDDVSRQLSQLRKAVLIRPDWISSEKCRQELQDLPRHEAFPEQGIVRWTSLQEEKEGLLLEHAEVKRRIDTMAKELISLLPNAAFLAKAEAIRSLHGRLAAYDSRFKEMMQLQAERKALRQRVAQCLRGINAGWTERELASFAGTVGEREAVRQFGARFAAYDKEMEQLQNERFKLEQEAAAAKEAYSAALSRTEESEAAGRRNFAVLAPQQPDNIRRIWSELRAELDRWRDTSSERMKEARHREAEAMAELRVRSLYRKLLIGCAAVTVMLPAAIWLASDSVSGTLAAGAVLVGLDLYLWLGMMGGSKPKSKPKPGHKSRDGMHRYAGEDDMRAEARLASLLASLVSHPLTAAGSADASRTDGAARSSGAAKGASLGAAPGAASFSLHAGEWEREERELRQLMENWQLWEQRHTAIQEEANQLRQRAVGAVNRCDHIERELARREARFEELARDWEHWLQERSLPEDLSPEAALDVFRLVEQGREWLGQVEQLNMKLAALFKENANFEQEAMKVQADLYGEGLNAGHHSGQGSESGLEFVFTHGSSAADLSSGRLILEQAEQGSELNSEQPQELASILTSDQVPELEERMRMVGNTLSDVMARLAENERIQAQRETLASRLEPLQEQLARLNDRLDRVAAREQALLTEAGVTDEEDFLRRGAEAVRRTELEREIRHLDTVMFSGNEQALRTELKQLLESCSEEELHSRLLHAQDRSEAKERSWRALQERRGRLLQEQESLEARCRQEDVNQQLAEQNAALQDSLDQYAVRAVCHELISRVRRVYEEERQPEVLRLASNYMQAMTNGQYERIVLKMGSQELLAEHREHGPIESASLSRGTAEQLYLSMRLALSEAVSHHRNIPLLLDDLFVNFDADRLQGVIAVLKEISSKRQMIMMTCHSHVVQGIQAQIPEAQIVNLG